MHFSYIMLIILFTSVSGFSDVKSTSGELKFFRQVGEPVDMVLDSTGLGIGLTPQSNLHVNGNTLISSKLTIGSSDLSNSNLHISGTLGIIPATVQEHITLSGESQVLVDSFLSSNVFITLPAASSVNGRIYRIKKISSSNNVVITGEENIDLNNSFFLSQGNSGSLKVLSNGSQWYILSSVDGESTHSPQILNITASDPNQDDYILDTGDQLTIAFDQATNEPPVSSYSEINELLDFDSEVLGANYSGSWISDNVLVITILDATGATLSLFTSISIKSAANLMTAEISTKASEDSSGIVGNFGSFDPSSLGNLRLWLDGSDIDGDGASEGLSEAGLTGNLIDSWEDKSGGNTATAVTTERPVYIPSELNGKGLVRFDGSDDHFDFNEVDNIRSVFIVAKEGMSGNGHLLGHQSSYHFHRNTGSPYQLYSSTYANSSIQNGETYYDGIEIDGTATTPGTGYFVLSIITTGSVESNRVGTDRGISSRFWDGDIAEILIYSDALSDDDRESMEFYLFEKWSLSMGVSLTSVIADDLDNTDDVLSESDNIILSFDLPTNRPDVSSKSEVDTLIDFNGYTFWTDYSGEWASTSQLVLTANGAGSGNLSIGANLAIKASGNLIDIYSLFGISTSSNLLDGNWGLSSNIQVQTTPTSFSNLVMWLDGADLDGDGYVTDLDEMGLDGNTISSWINKADGSEVVAASSDERPIYQPGTLNGNALVFFDGTDDFLSFSEIDDIRTVFWVVREANTTNNFLLGHSSTYHFHRNSATIWHATHAHANVKSGNTYVDGSLVTGTSTALPTDFTQVSLVTDGPVEANTLVYDRGIAGRSWDGEVAELIIYNKALSDADRLTIEAYLREKWGLP